MIYLQQLLFQQQQLYLMQQQYMQMEQQKKKGLVENGIQSSQIPQKDQFKEYQSYYQNFMSGINHNSNTNNENDYQNKKKFFNLPMGEIPETKESFYDDASRNTSQQVTRGNGKSTAFSQISSNLPENDEDSRQGQHPNNNFSSSYGIDPKHKHKISDVSSKSSQNMLISEISNKSSPQKVVVEEIPNWPGHQYHNSEGSCGQPFPSSLIGSQGVQYVSKENKTTQHRKVTSYFSFHQQTSTRNNNSPVEIQNQPSVLFPMNTSSGNSSRRLSQDRSRQQDGKHKRHQTEVAIEHYQPQLVHHQSNRSEIPKEIKLIENKGVKRKACSDKEIMFSAEKFTKKDYSPIEEETSSIHYSVFNRDNQEKLINYILENENTLNKSYVKTRRNHSSNGFENNSVSRFHNSLLHSVILDQADPAYNERKSFIGNDTLTDLMDNNEHLENKLKLKKFLFENEEIEQRCRSVEAAPYNEQEIKGPFGAFRNNGIRIQQEQRCRSQPGRQDSRKVRRVEKVVQRPVKKKVKQEEVKITKRNSFPCKPNRMILNGQKKGGKVENKKKPLAPSIPQIKKIIPKQKNKEKSKQQIQQVQNTEYYKVQQQPIKEKTLNSDIMGLHFSGISSNRSVRQSKRSQKFGQTLFEFNELLSPCKKKVKPIQHISLKPSLSVSRKTSQNVTEEYSTTTEHGKRQTEPNSKSCSTRKKESSNSVQRSQCLAKQITINIPIKKRKVSSLSVQSQKENKENQDLIQEEPAIVIEKTRPSEIIQSKSSLDSEEMVNINLHKIFFTKNISQSEDQEKAIQNVDIQDMFNKFCQNKLENETLSKPEPETEGDQNEFIYSAGANQDDPQIMNLEIVKQEQQHKKEDLKKRLDNYYKLKISSSMQARESAESRNSATLARRESTSLRRPKQSDLQQLLNQLDISHSRSRCSNVVKGLSSFNSFQQKVFMTEDIQNNEGLLLTSKTKREVMKTEPDDAESIIEPRKIEFIDTQRSYKQGKSKSRSPINNRQPAKVCLPNALFFNKPKKQEAGIQFYATQVQRQQNTKNVSRFSPNSKNYMVKNTEASNYDASFLYQSFNKHTITDMNDLNKILQSGMRHGQDYSDLKSNSKIQNTNKKRTLKLPDEEKRSLRKRIQDHQNSNASMTL